MLSDIFDDTIDKIYEAAVISEQWPDVLRRLSDIAGCKDGMLVANPQTKDARWVATGDLVPMMAEFTRDNWGLRNGKAARLAPLRYPGFVADTDLWTLDEIESEPFMRELARPHGFGYSTGSMIYVPTGDLLVFDIERALGQPPVEREAIVRLDKLRPHLARAALISARLGLERARAMVESLELTGLPAAAFARDGRVLAANHFLETLDRQFVTRALGRLALADAAANSLLTQALERAAAGAWDGGTLSFPVPAVEDQPALIAHLVPIKRAAHDIFTGALSILVVTPLAGPEAPSEDLLNGLFDLTPAEARVAKAIVDGETVQALAATLGLSRETIRGQLKAVLAKTGASRQAELVRLLVGTRIPLHRFE